MSATPEDEVGSQRLLGDNVVVDYTRDSPVFRQQVEGFNDSLKGLKEYYRRVVSAAEAYVEAGHRMADFGDDLALELCNREFARSLFTNAHKDELGALSVHLLSLESTLRKVQSAQRQLLSRVSAGIGPLRSFLEGDLKDTDSMIKDVWKLGDAHEALLMRTLESVDSLQGRHAASLGSARSRFELSRFDMVQYLNQVDGRKKLRVVSAVDRISEAFAGFFKEGHTNVMGPQEESMRARRTGLEEAEQNFGHDTSLWKAVRSRLEAELQGALPPPGAPVGAFSPVFPRQESATPAYLATLTTEVLGRNSKQASHADLSHARDEGVLKQGYLISAATFGWTRKRRWYRLHDGSLYYLALSAAYDPSFVCSVRDASVSLSSSRAPFSFIVEDPSGPRSVELQAENEDEMLKWITAIRRCRKRFRRRRSNSSSGSAGNNGPSAAEAVAMAPHPLMAELRAANPRCCECDDPEVTWAAYNIGCVLCEQCASVHRQLGLATSKLRSLELDDWPEALLECFVRSLGNEAVNSVWEVSVMKGWTRPKPRSPIEKKSEWITSKYSWFAFVQEDRGDRETNSRRLYQAAAKGDTREAMWCLAHKASITWTNPDDSNRTALHASTLGGHCDCTLFLLLNGAHALIRAPDDSRQTCYDVARASGATALLKLFLAVEKGDFL